MGNAPDETKHHERLAEIRETKFGDLSDEQVLEFLAERKRLDELRQAYEAKQHEDEAKAELEGKRAKLLQEIGTLNKDITPDKEDEELLALINQRKKLEDELEALGGEVPERQEEAVPEKKKAPKKEEAPQEAPKEEAAPAPEEAPEAAEETKVPEPPKSIFKEDSGFGQEAIVQGSPKEIGEFSRFLHELETNHDSLGSFLQNLPKEAKMNEAFMLKVAEVDPAYAMHYADQTLKHDEKWNVKVASMKNSRNSGNALAEMLPEARTGQVVLACTTQDFRNVRFATPDMAEYDRILEVAKGGTLAKVKDLKEAADAHLLVPKILQKDKAFMQEVEKIIKNGKK